MRIIPITLSYLVGTSYGFFRHSANTEERRQQRGRMMGLATSNPVNNFNNVAHIMSNDNNNKYSSSEFNQNSDNNYDTSTDANAIIYSLPPLMGAAALQQKERSTSNNSNRLRSTNDIDNNNYNIMTPNEAITDGHEDNVMILSSDYMYVSNCLLKGKHHDDPLRQRAFDLFKQTAAGDWFIVFGYVCNLDYRCWKKSVANLLAKKGDTYGGLYVGRCVGRLVRDKADGIRQRRRKKRSNK